MTDSQSPTAVPVRAAVLARARKHGRERGASMFIVATTLTIVASLGLYAMSSATAEVRTSGFARQNAQSHYLSEYGTLGAAETVNQGTAQLMVGLMTNPSRRDTKCISLPGVPTTATPQEQACRRVGSKEMAQTWTATSQLALNATNALGPYPLSGDFFIEMTDPVQTTPPAGADLRIGLCYMQMTVASVGITQPLITGTPNPTAFFGSQALEQSRARFRVGPIRCAP